LLQDRFPLLRLEGSDAMTLIDLFELIRKQIRLVVILPIACALFTFAFSMLVLPNEYTAVSSMYVLTQTSQDAEGISDTDDLTASQMLTNDVAKLVTSNRVEQDAAAALGMDDLLKFKINVDSNSNTRVLNVYVTGKSAEEAAAVANELAHAVNDVAIEVMNVESINVIDDAQIPQYPSGPPRLIYTLVAFLIGLFVAISIIVISDMANTRVRTPEEAQELLDLPIIGRIPKMD